MHFGTLTKAMGGTVLQGDRLRVAVTHGTPFIVLTVTAIWSLNALLDGHSGGFLNESPDPDDCIQAHMRIDEINYELSQLEGLPGTELQQASLWVERTWLELGYGHCSAYGDH